MPVVLIVDDRSTNLRVLRRCAEQLGSGVAVHTFADASKALANLPNVLPDLIVTDYVMPGMNGEEFIRQCRRHDITRTVPIIVVTAFEDREFRYRALDAGASDFLLSPPDPREFRIRAEHLLTIREQEKTLQRYASSLESELATTLRQHAEEILRREQQLRRIVNTVPALIRACDGGSSILLLNEYHERFFSVDTEATRVSDPTHAFGEQYLRRHRELAAKIRETGQTVVGIEEVLTDRQGTERVLLTTKAPLLDAQGGVSQVVTVSLDITERKCGERALQESERRFRHLVEGSVLGIVIVRDGRPLFANRTFATIFGYETPEEILAFRSLDRLYSPAEIDRIRHLRSAWMHGEATPTSYEYQGVRKDGSLIWVEAMIREIVWEGEPAIQKTVADITLRKQYEERLERQANFDEITGLPNRVLALDRLRGAVLSARRHHHRAGILFLDLDHFKKINDTLGHATGDLLLTLAAKRLTGCVRAEDTVARLGGDEFTVILPKLASAADTEPVIQKILDTFSLPFDLGSEEAFVTASIGVSVAPEDGDDPHVLMQNADAAMYRAKEQGRNTFHFFTPELNRRAVERMRMESHLLHALDRNEFRLHFQPIVDLRSNAIVGAEALLRWLNPVLGEVEPERFIPLAEDTGLIIPIGRWVLDAACRQAAQWQELGIAPIRVSVNISSRQFRGSNLLDATAEALHRHRLAPEHLELEITEGLLMDELPQTRANFRQLAALAVRLSLDDFGTGYSSLRYLRQFPVDTLKIDKSFVREVATDTDDATVVEAIIAMAHRLGLQVIGEGIETEAQLRFMRARGCDLAQGYYFSEPLTADAFSRWIRERGAAAGAALEALL
jgi:diguanylate cyclase (GGDEF)-like protein/PAS domain S-box-containing protein